MLAFYFPPLGGGGVQRSVKYVKYLPAAGFQPTVVAGSTQWRYFARDPTLVREIPPDVVVLRPRELPLREAMWNHDELRRRLRLPPRGGYPLWPDEMVGWLPAAVWHGMRVIRATQPDVLYSTSSPGTNHLAALVVHRLTGLPWVADFRDGWTREPLGIEDSGYALANRATATLEQRVVRRATRITLACQSISLCGLSAGDPRVTVIPNGVDPDDARQVSPLRPEPDPHRFRLSYVGSLYRQNDLAPILAAVRELIQRGRLDPDTFQLRIVGNVALPRMRFDSLPVTFTGYVDHMNGLREMASADALLFSLPPQHPGTSGKVFEYLASGRPILSVTHPENAGARLVRELGGGICADARDVRDVAAALESLLERWRAGSLSVAPEARGEVLRRFSRQELAADLAQVLREAAGTRAEFKETE